MSAERAFYCIANGAGELAHDYKKQRRRLMKLQILVSSLNQEVKSLAEKNESAGGCNSHQSV